MIVLAKGIVCPKCRDDDGRPIRLHVTSIYHAAPGITYRYKVCPRCQHFRVRTRESVVTQPKVLLPVANHA